MFGSLYVRVTPAAIGLIGTTFPEGPAKSRAFAGLGAGAPVGTAIGLVLAGITTQYTPAGWSKYRFLAAVLLCLTSYHAYRDVFLDLRRVIMRPCPWSCLCSSRKLDTPCEN
jgi:MFS family permease